jgi:viroplasmin and RNaseH domain-containing protein
MAKSKNVAYVVFAGRKTGVFKTWAECEAQVKGFSGSQFKGFVDYRQAEDAWEEWELRPQEVLSLPSVKAATRIVLDGRNGITLLLTQLKFHD